MAASLSLAAAQMLGLHILLLPGRGSRDRAFALLFGVLTAGYLVRPVIAAFGRLIRAGLREGDICGRFGGEEFCIYLRNSDLRAARLFAEWLRVAFAATSYPELKNTVRFTASFGVTEVLANERIEDAYKRADAALYQAKRDGRNCVRIRDREGGSEKLSGIRFSARTTRT